MISSINYRGLIKLVLHYRANNSFRPSPPANSDTQITIQSNLTNLFDSASTFREHFTKISRYFSQQFLPAENQMNHALIWKLHDHDVVVADDDEDLRLPIWRTEHFLN